MGFSWKGAKEILKNGGEDLLKERYGDFYFEEFKDFNFENGKISYDIVLTVDPESKPKKMKAPEGANEEEKAKIKEDNSIFKVKLAEFAEGVADRWCRLKSEFMGAPIRKALIDVKEENKENYFIEIPYRMDEKYWVKKTDTSALFYFNIHFTDPTDIALAKIMCNELKDIKHISSKSISINYNCEIIKRRRYLYISP